MTFLENIFNLFFYVVVRPGNLLVSKMKTKISSELHAVKRKEFQTLCHDTLDKSLSSDIATAAQVKYKTSHFPKAEINL